MSDLQNRQSQAILIKNIKREFTNFVQSWQQKGFHKYRKLAEVALGNDKHTVLISLKDFMNYNDELAQTIFNEYYKFQPHLNQAMTQFIHQYGKNINAIQDNKQQQEKQRYDITFDQGFICQIQNSVRDLKSQHLGKLKSFRGTVTRTSQVRPELLIGVFKCMTCGTLSRQIPQQFKYTQPKKCLKNNCDNPVWELDMKRSRFADFQKVRVQEDPTKIPPGAMPRSIDVVLRNENTEKGQPGDILYIVGYLCVSPQVASMLKPGQKTQLSTRNMGTRGNMGQIQGVTGLKGVRQLNYKLVFIATHIRVENNQFAEQIQDDEQQQEIMEMQLEQNKQQIYTNQYFLSKIYSRLSQMQIREIKKLKQNPRLYDDLSESLFPSIFGHSQIKKALLLQLFGGIHKKTETKINIRGDINILIVGDPSTAKSQFLKCVNKFVPRSVYTNGKTTSAAGLTASVTKDENGNVGIQAGALMLADNGICCIDQFDKMDIKDQTAIHQAMEQQTISIAKAGVYATLNARTSILAAANPLFGRYDKSKALKYNINISPPIMSRFDLFFIICDQTDNIADVNLGRFIVDLHRKKNQSIVSKYDYQTIKKYIMVAKKIKPRITKQAAELLRKYYIQLRIKDKSQNQNNSYRITVRQLESMIRLSQAYARLELNPQINGQHVKQAYRLLSCSIIKLQKSPIELNTEQQMGEDMGNMNRLNRNLMDEQIERKKQEKKSKSMTISYQLYQEAKNNIEKLFKDKQRRHRQGEQDLNVSQQDLISYLLNINFQNDAINSQEDAENMKKILKAIVKKLIRQERMLIVVQQSSDSSQRILGLHPNYAAQ